MHKLIFEGAELSGKSYTIYQVWNFLEETYNQSGHTLDGCIWFNADNGVFGLDSGWDIIRKYVEIGKILANKNIIFEKFHLSQAIYSTDQSLERFHTLDKILKKQGYKLIFTLLPDDLNVISARLEDRIRLSPSYQRIAKKPQDYLKQQEKYLELLRSSSLDRLILDNANLPNNQWVKTLRWIGEV